MSRAVNDAHLPTATRTAPATLLDRPRRSAADATRSRPEQPRILRLVAHRGDIGAEGARTQVGEGRARRLAGEGAEARNERRLDFLAVGLADRPKAHHRRDG